MVLLKDHFHPSLTQKILSSPLIEEALKLGLVEPVYEEV